MIPNDLPLNLDVYRAADVVSNYTRQSGLQPAEKAILQEFESQLATFRLLDIGIGTGRTTEYLAQRVGEYVGVDYSPEMIQVCEQRFDSTRARARLAVCDARDMSQFADWLFDFVFFSYNGLDCLPHKDRLIILREINRVLKPGGWFAFSSHNLLYFPRLFRFPWVRPLARMRRKIKARRTLLQCHPDFRQIACEPHAFVFDGTFEFRARHYYISPGPQVDQLEQAGFSGTRIFANDGEEMIITARRLNRSPWIYYLCQNTGPCETDGRSSASSGEGTV